MTILLLWENESVVKRILLISVMGLLLSGCFMVPLALIGPATSGYTASSVMQAAVTSTANHMVKKATGKSLSEHAFDAINVDDDITLGYFPENKSNNLILPLTKPLNIN